MSVKLDDLVRGRQRLGLDGISPAPQPRPTPPPPPPPAPGPLDLLNDLLRAASSAQGLLRPFLVAWIVVGVVAYALLDGAWRALTWPWRRREPVVMEP